MKDSPTLSGARRRPVVLCILDGWGVRKAGHNNAIWEGETPTWDRLIKNCPSALLEACGPDVGLPEGQMGNSEVGHMNLGAGRIVLQDLPRIDQAVADGSLAQSPALKDFIKKLKNSGGACHLMGLLSPGGVHSHQDHITALAKIVAQAGVPVFVHPFLDGRDTPPRSAHGYMGDFLATLEDIENVSIATICGRYYAMDRDNRWDRVAMAYEALVCAKGGTAKDPMSAIKDSYAVDIGDEFVLPVVIEGYGGMKDEDGLLMANFRADRARQILESLSDPDFSAFERSSVVRCKAALGMAPYSSDLDHFYPALFPSPALDGILGQVVSEAGLSQLRIAETEKYAHVTFFLNGGREAVYPKEERILVPSPKVATYDLQPEMSAANVTDKLVAAIKSGNFDLIVANYANGDMVGHTGILEAAKKAAGTVDECLARLEASITQSGGVLLITADHGNCEMMMDEASGQPHTAHTLSKVPLILIGGEKQSLTDGRLADVAPTVLDFLGLEKPEQMSGHSLVVVEHAARTR
jgi:2,3-bisphosphoglycerate-independent phosphoglycerate mutase